MLQLREERARYVAADPQVRTCSRCGEAKRIDEFPIKNKATGLRRVWCRDCCRAYGREHYQKNKPVYLAKAARRRGPDRQRIRDLIRQYLLAHPCVDCGETNILLLDFDHRDRSEKRDMISRIALGGSWPRVLREIEKCDVRCANCHRLRTAGQLRWRKDPARGALPAPLIALLGPTLTRPSITGAAVTEQPVDLVSRDAQALSPLRQGQTHSRVLIHGPEDPGTKRLSPIVPGGISARSLPKATRCLHQARACSGTTQT